MSDRRQPDPIGRRSERLFRLFAGYLAWRMSRAFHGLRVSQAGGVPADPRRPIIIYSNHPSWWDPAVFLVLAARLFPGRPGFGPMDAEAFRRYGVFRRMGVFGISLDSRAGARRFLETSERVLALPGGMMWITAEGTLSDPRVRPLRLRPGIAHLARRAPDALLVPLALGYEFWGESRPEILVRFGEPVAVAGPADVSVAEQLARALEDTMDALAADAMTHDPARFRVLVRGTSGADVIYDQWRRGAALLRGERFRASHGDGA